MQLFGDVSIQNVVITRQRRPGQLDQSLAFGGVQMKQLRVKPPGGQRARPASTASSSSARCSTATAGPLSLANLSVGADGSQIA